MFSLGMLEGLMKGKVESHKILDPMPNGRPSLFARDANCEKLGCGQIGCWGLIAMEIRVYSISCCFKNVQMVLYGCL